MNTIQPYAAATEIVGAVRNGVLSARAVTEAALARIASVNPQINAFSEVTAERALAQADRVDADLAAGRVGALAGVPFAVKNLFDLEGLTTLAGARLTRKNPPAASDADLVVRMEAAGAVCVGALHMGEFAYDFTGENAHYGPCRNPHDTSRMTGGSSSGSGAATAAAIAPISLGSDTNGSLRVPASLCGVFSLKPTYGRLSRGGSYPFVDSLDHVGPLARSTLDLATAYDALTAPGPSRDHAHAAGVAEAAVPGISGPDVKVGILRGWFEENASDEALDRRDRAAAVFPIRSDMVLDGAPAGRAAAYLITNAESADLHLKDLREAPGEFDPDTRDRFFAGALLPGQWVLRAQRVRRWWLDDMLSAFARSSVDVLLAPATPVTAPLLGQRMLTVGGREVPLRPNLGLLAQPFSCIGLPVVTVPVFASGELPLGVQLVAPPWKEDVALRAAAQLEAAGFTAHAPSQQSAHPSAA